MLTKDGNQINMALTVQKVLNDHKSVWGAYSGFIDEAETFFAQLEVVKKHLEHAEVATEGVTKDKANAGDRAIEKGLALAGGAYVFAKKMNNETLKKQFNIPKKALTEVQGVVTLNRLQELHTNLSAVKDQIGDYVSQNDLAVFAELIGNFENQLANPRKTIVKRSESNDMIAETIREIRSTLENLDKLMAKFNDTEFERQYRKARIIVDLGSRKAKEDKGNEEMKG